MMKRLTAVLLALVLTLSMVPAAAFAQEETAPAETAPVEEAPAEPAPEESIPQESTAEEPSAAEDILSAEPTPIPEDVILIPEEMDPVIAEQEISVNIGTCDIFFEEYPAYNGKYQKPKIYVVTPQDVLLEEGVHYETSFKNNKNIGVATVTVTGIGSCHGTKEEDFPIVPPAPKDLKLEDLSATRAVISYSKVKLADGYVIYVNGEQKTETTDTTAMVYGLVAGQSNVIMVQAVTEAGYHLIGSNIYEGLEVIPGYDLSWCEMKVTEPLAYEGHAVYPVPEFTTHLGDTLKEGTHFHVTYENNDRIGLVTVTAAGINGITGVVTTDIVLAPPKVTNIHTQATGLDSIRVTFDAARYADKYIVRAACGDHEIVEETSNTTCDITGMKLGEAYSITVQSVATVEGQDYASGETRAVTGRAGYLLQNCTVVNNTPVMVTHNYPDYPDVVITNEQGEVLVQWEDYKIECLLDRIGRTPLKITGLGKYAGEQTVVVTYIPRKPMNVEAAVLTNTSARLSFSDYIPASREGWFEIYVDGELNQTVTESPATITGLVEGNTYTFTVRECIQVEGEVFSSEHSDTAVFTSTYPMRQTAVTLEAEELVYTGSWIRPAVTVTTAEGVVLTEGKDYQITYKDNKEVGIARVTVTGMGAFTGSKTVRFIINPRGTKNLRVTEYTANSLKIAYDGVSEATVYNIFLDGEYVDNTTKRYYTFEDLNCGQLYEITVQPRTTVVEPNGNRVVYFGETAAITAAPGEDIARGDMEITQEKAVFTGQAVTPAVTVENSDGQVLAEGTNYTVSYENNEAIGEGTVIVAGIGGYTGTMEARFTILPDQVQNLQAEVAGSGTVILTYDPVVGAQEYWIYRGGKRIAKTEDTTYTVTGLSAGTTYAFYVKAAAEADGEDFTGQSSQTVKATPVYTLDDATLTLSGMPMTCTGKARVPTVKVKTPSGKTLKKGRDYAVTCENNTGIGTATLTVTGIGKYTGSLSATFEIVPGRANTPSAEALSGTSAEITFKALPGAQWYEIYANGEPVARTEDTLCVIEGLEPNVSYKFTVRGGATVEGREYLGSESKSDSVTLRHKMAHCAVQLSPENFVYTGSYLRPEVTVYGVDGEILEEGRDCTLRFKNNKASGQAYVQITGKGAYTGTVKAYYVIEPVRVENVRVTATTSTSVTVGYNKSSSIKYYEIYVDGSYAGRTTGGSYTVKNLVAGQTHEVFVIGTKTSGGTTYKGQPSEAISIRTGANIGKCKATLEYTKADYAGAPLTPTAVVKTSSRGKTLTEGVDYTVRYENNDAPGKAKVILEGIGAYAGTLTKTFTIYPAQVTGVEATAEGKTICLSFDAVEGADTYWVYVNGSRKAKITDTQYTVTGLKANRTYKITVKAVTTVDGTNYTGDASEPVSVKTEK